MVAGAVSMTHALSMWGNKAEVINIAGAQRMLSQQIVALAMQLGEVQDETSRNETLIRLNAAVARMELGHFRLTLPQADGTVAKDLTPEIRAHYDGSKINLDARVRAFLFATRRILAEGGQKPEAVEELSRIALDPLLSDLDRAVTLYEARAKTELENIYALHLAISMIGLLLLVIEAQFIFKPMASVVQRQSDDSEKKARIDGLTGLLNRGGFEFNFRKLLKIAHHKAGPDEAVILSVIAVDLDWFKEINDLEGHAAGDAVLREIGKRLSNAAPRDSVAARLGGDEFAIVVPYSASDDRCQALAVQIRKAIEQPVAWHEKQLRVGATIGIANFPDHGSSFEELLSASDYALRSGKRQGKGSVCLFATEHKDALHREKIILGLLHEGQNLEGLAVGLQPIINLRTGALVGCEALARWTHPMLGPIRPDELMGIAAAHGHGGSLGQQLREAAFSAFADIRKAGHTVAYLAINVSGSEVDALPGAEFLIGQLANHGLTAADIQLEIVEDVFLDRASGRVQAKLETLRQSGFALSLDDFGTGYASLSHLVSFQVDVIKIDRSFVATIGQDSRCRQIATAIVQLGHLLGVRVVAEGVETIEQQLILQTIGCDYGQGYLYAPAMKPDVFSEWVNAEHRLLPN